MRFVHFLKDDTGLLALVFQHRLEHGPARVQRAFGYLGFDQLRAAHVAHKNGGVVFHQRAAELVQTVLALVFDLGVDGPDAALLLGAPRCGQRFFMEKPTTFTCWLTRPRSHFPVW